MTQIIRIKTLPPEVKSLIQPWFDKHTQDQLQSSETKTFNLIAKDNDAIIGIVTVGCRHKYAHINELIVHESARGNGLGRQLMEEAETVCKQLGMLSLVLSTWSHQAPLFYQKMGFEVVGKTIFRAGLPQKFWLEKPI